jgi:hypothetical protein
MTSTRQFPILTFSLVGVLSLFASNVLILSQQSLARGPHRHLAAILAYVWNLIGPRIWLLIIAFCFLLTTGNARPVWTRGHWPLAIVILYVFQIPLMLLVPPTILGRWGFAVFLFLGSVGVVCAMSLLMRRFHIAAFFILAEPLVRTICWAHLHDGTRSVAMKLLAIVGFSLIGWWFRDTGVIQTVETTAVPAQPEQGPRLSKC